ncbi:hypothetical protein ACQEU3_24335 [Spirillospora sp. CA-253888]
MNTIAPLRPGDPRRIGKHPLSGLIAEGGNGTIYLSGDRHATVKVWRRRAGARREARGVGPAQRPTVRDGRTTGHAATCPTPLPGERLLAGPDARFGYIFTTHSGVFIAEPPAWDMALDGYSPDRYDLLDAAICLVEAAVITYTARD